MLKIYSSSEEIKDDKLATFEAWLGYELPEDYRRFLLKHNGGFPNMDAFEYDGYHQRSEGGVNRFFSITENDLKISIQKYRTLFLDKGLPENLLPIADDGVGNFIFLSLTDPDKGKIFYWLHELPASDIFCLR